MPDSKIWERKTKKSETKISNSDKNQKVTKTKICQNKENENFNYDDGEKS